MLWRPVELSQTSCNRAEWYASPHKRHQLTGPSYINLSSLTNSLPSIMPLSSSQPRSAHESATRWSWRGCFCCQWWASVWFSPAATFPSNGDECLHMNVDSEAWILCSKHQNVQPSKLQWSQTRWEVRGSFESLVLIGLWGRTVCVTGWSVSKQTLMLLGGRLYWSLTFLPTRP